MIRRTDFLDLRSLRDSISRGPEKRKQNAFISTAAIIEIKNNNNRLPSQNKCQSAFFIPCKIPSKKAGFAISRYYGHKRCYFNNIYAYICVYVLLYICIVEQHFGISKRSPVASSSFFHKSDYDKKNLRRPFDFFLFCLQYGFLLIIDLRMNELPPS